MNLKKVFFSYSRTDFSGFVLRLALDLKKEGFDVWIDQEDIRAGSEWDLEIEKALETCDCLLFIQSEKSVTSTNVLDEVYYALEEHKRVIPIIIQESKTPFRIKRLNYIDFTKDYEPALANLVSELKGDFIPELSQMSEGTELKKLTKPFFSKYSWFVLIIIFLVIIAAVAIIYSTNNKRELNKTGDNTEPNKPADKITNLNDPIAADRKLADVEPGLEPKRDLTIKKTDNKKAGIQDNDKKELNTTVDKTVDKTADKIVNLNETFTGLWKLVEVEPKAASKSGYLKIEETDEKKVKILSSFQFYFFKSNDTAFFSVFNGFVGCASCVLQNEMKITDYDAAFGTQTYRTLKKTQAGIGKAGDTIASVGSNTSIRATVTLHLINKETVIIKVQKSVATPLSNGFVVEPFVYTFRFTKDD